MKVILLKNVKSLGREGDVVEVSAGHAQNFLFPETLAVQATATELRRKKDREQALKRADQRELSKAGKVAEELEGFQLLLPQKTNKDGGLYAAITSSTIVKALEEEGFAVKASMLRFSDPIKEVGEYEVTIVFPHDFEAKIQLLVEAV